MNNSQNYKKILIVRLDRIGDVVLSTPAIKALREAFPDSHITFMVRPYALDIVKGNPYLDDVIVYDKEGGERGILGNIKFILDLRRRRFDLAVILHPTARTHIVTFLSGIAARVGYDKKMGWLLTKKIPHTKQLGSKHEIDYTLDILRHIGIGAADRTLYMPIRPESEARVKTLFKNSRIGQDDTVIVINPGASCPSKRWRAENFARASDSLIEKYAAKIIIISDKTCKGFCEEVSSSMDRPCINLAGGTSVGDIASLLLRARLFISNDSGPVHIACAVGTPVIAIFGRSDRGLSPKRWGPVGKDDIVLHKNVGCVKCLAHNCGIGFKCLEAVTVEDVLAAADKILEPGV